VSRGGAAAAPAAAVRVTAAALAAAGAAAGARGAGAPTNAAGIAAAVGTAVRARPAGRTVGLRTQRVQEGRLREAAKEAVRGGVAAVPLAHMTQSDLQQPLAPRRLQPPRTAAAAVAVARAKPVA
jgi:hypothetical protein